MSEEIVTKKSFLQIKSIRTSSNAFVMKLKEGDVIIALEGEMVHESYEELSKKLTEIKEKNEKKVITFFRDGVFFNTFIYGPLGVICENITSEKIQELENPNINAHFQQDEFYYLFEVFKKPGSVANLLNTMPSILTSIAPPLWMVQNRLWTYFCLTMVFYFSVHQLMHKNVIL